MKEPIFTVTPRNDYRLLCTIKRIEKKRVQIQFADSRVVTVEEGDCLNFSWTETED